MPERRDGLKQELETYGSCLPKWGDMEGQFVLIGGSEVCAFYDECVKALTAGYIRFGIMPFLVKKVEQQQEARHVTRLFTPRLAF